MVDFEQDIRNCIKTLEQGGSILYPTDTVWGLGCDALNEAAVAKLFLLKKRPKEKSVIILLADARDIFQYVAAPPPDIVELIEQFKQPTTVIYEGALDIATGVVHESGTVAIRVTADPFCKALIKRFRRPIVSTSANTSGHATPVNFNEIESSVIRQVDYVVQYRRDDLSGAKPSRLIRLNDDGIPEILRP